MRIITIIISLLCFGPNTAICSSEEITPYKYSDLEAKEGFPSYIIPKSSRHAIKRHQPDAPDIIFYYSKPKQAQFPIIIFCTGSTSRDSIPSVIHVHRYFLKELLDLGAGVITLEQWGVDGSHINADEFMRHYTISQRLIDHKTTIEYLLKNPPIGWNGKFIFVGVSEGGPIVTSLTTKYPDITLATVNWSGAGDWNWREELWAFFILEDIKNDIPWYIKIRSKLPSWFPFSVHINLPTNREEYDKIMDQTIINPTTDKEFMGMTYKYHADSLQAPRVEYNKITTPYLVVSGAKDTIIQSSDEFVEKAKNQGADITYLRIPDMDHYVRKRPDVLQKSFDWLKKILLQASQYHTSTD